MRYALVWLVKHSQKAVILRSSIPSTSNGDPDVGDIVAVSIGTDQQHVKILKFSENFDWLGKLNVSDGEIVPSTKKDVKKMSRARNIMKNPLRKLEKKSVFKLPAVAKQLKKPLPVNANRRVKLINRKRENKNFKGEHLRLSGISNTEENLRYDDKDGISESSDEISNASSGSSDTEEDFQQPLKPLPSKVTSDIDIKTKKSENKKGPNQKFEGYDQYSSGDSNIEAKLLHKDEISLFSSTTNPTFDADRQKSVTEIESHSTMNIRRNNQSESSISSHAEEQSNMLDRSAEDEEFFTNLVSTVVRKLQDSRSISTERNSQDSICPEMVASITQKVLGELPKEGNHKKMKLHSQRPLKLRKLQKENAKTSRAPKMVELYDGSGVYIEYTEKKIILNWARNPNYMIRALMLNLVGAEELKKSTARGKTTCPNKEGEKRKPIPENILLAVKNFIDANGLYQMSDADYHKVINQQCHTLRNPKEPKQPSPKE